jgi:SAP domain
MELFKGETVADLKNKLRQKGAKVTGTKAILQER